MKRRSLVLRLTALLLTSACGNHKAWCAPSPKDVSPTEAPRSFCVDGEVELPQSWTTARLRETFDKQIQTVHYTLHDKEMSAQCVPLLTVLEASRLRLKTERKGAQLAMVVVVRGLDGYCIALGLGEMLPEIGGRQIWLALDADGKPLSDKEAPVRLLIPKGKKPARWLFGIASVTLVDEAATKGQ